MFFFVKARIDVAKLREYGAKIQSGGLPAHPIITYCLQDDPSVGLNVWQADHREGFEQAFSPHREFYSEIIEIVPVITPNAAMQALLSLPQESQP